MIYLRFVYQKWNSIKFYVYTWIVVCKIYQRQKYVIIIIVMVEIISLLNLLCDLCSCIMWTAIFRLITVKRESESVT